MVIGLLGIVALTATTFIVEDKGFEFQDATQKRWNQIRKAIIGDTSRTLNNEPIVSGYVADMGRLPANLQEQPRKALSQLGQASNLVQQTLYLQQKALLADGAVLIFTGQAVRFLEMAGAMRMR